MEILIDLKVKKWSELLKLENILDLVLELISHSNNIN